MPVPAREWSVSGYVLKQKLKGRKRYPLVLMLEPLFAAISRARAAGRSSIPGLRKRDSSPEACFRAVEECSPRAVASPAANRSCIPAYGEIVDGLVARRQYVYLCTNALLLERKLLFSPSGYLTFSVHLEGASPITNAGVHGGGVRDRAPRHSRGSQGGLPA